MARYFTSFQDASLSFWSLLRMIRTLPPSATEGFRIVDYRGADVLLGVAAVLAVINTVITTALGTLGAFLYNLSANILGGLELTLAED